MSEQNKAAAVAFYRKALIERNVETASRLYAGPYYRQHNPPVEDGEDEFLGPRNRCSCPCLFDDGEAARPDC